MTGAHKMALYQPDGNKTCGRKAGKYAGDSILACATLVFCDADKPGSFSSQALCADQIEYGSPGSSFFQAAALTTLEFCMFASISGTAVSWLLKCAA